MYLNFKTHYIKFLNRKIWNEWSALQVYDNNDKKNLNIKLKVNNATG